MSSDGNLVLSRKVNESIIIGDEVEVQVIEFRPGKVRLRIKAPKSINIRRAELQEAVINGANNAVCAQQECNPARLNSFAVPPELVSFSQE